MSILSYINMPIISTISRVYAHFYMVCVFLISPALPFYIVNYSVGKQEISYYLIDFCPNCVKVHLSTLKYVADIGIML